LITFFRSLRINWLMVGKTASFRMKF